MRTMINRYGERGHPCLTPLCWGWGREVPFVSLTEKVRFWYSASIACTNDSGAPNRVRALEIDSCEMESKAFDQSSRRR